MCVCVCVNLTERERERERERRGRATDTKQARGRVQDGHLLFPGCPPVAPTGVPRILLPALPTFSTMGMLDSACWVLLPRDAPRAPPPRRDWNFIAEQPAPAPHFARPEGRAALTPFLNRILQPALPTFSTMGMLDPAYWANPKPEPHALDPKP